MIPVLTDLIDTCVICGDVCGNRDLFYAEEEDARLYECEVNDLVCRDCIGSEPRA